MVSLGPRRPSPLGLRSDVMHQAMVLVHFVLQLHLHTQEVDVVFHVALQLGPDIP